MLRPRPWAAVAVLGTALAIANGSARATDPPAAAATPTSKPGFFSRLFGKSPKPKPKPTAPEPPPNPGAIAAEQREQEQDAYLRRLAVCDRIKLIAREMGDQKLEEQADFLAMRAEQVYQQRTSHLPSSRVRLSEAETALDAQLGTAATGPAAANRLTPPQTATGAATASAVPKGVRP